MLKQRAQWFAAGLVACEAASWAASFGLVRAALLSQGGPALADPRDAGVVLAAGAATWTIYSVGWLGRSRRTEPPWTEVPALVGGAVAAGLAAAATWFFLALPGDGRLFLPLWSALALLVVAGLRQGVRAVLRHARTRGYNYRTVAIVGTGPLARALAESVLAHRAWGLHLVGFVRAGAPANGGDVPADPPEGPVLGDLADMGAILDGHVVDEVLFAVESAQLAPYEEALAVCEEAGVTTKVVLHFFPHKFARMALEDFDGFPTLAFKATPDAWAGLVLKRAFDLVVAGVAVTLGAPVFLAVALLVKLSSPGPVLYVQRRVGLNGREFDLYKFRSMVDGADVRKGELVGLNEMNGPAFKIANDPRVTSVGRWLRRTSLDEIPQFVNVLKGDMSVVGPRPPLPSEVARYERWQRRRLSVKPGITCTWQVSGRNELDFDTWMRLDLAYIDNWSLWLDLRILAATVPAVLLMRGAR